MSALARSALLAVVAVTAAGCSVFGGKAAEEPAYTMERQEGAFEIRAYPGLVVARTTAPGDRDAATSEGFMRLFDYITGENGGAREIEMTAPVIASQGAETTEGAEIAMTAPVIGTPVRGGAETPDPDAAGAEIAMTAPVIGTPADAAAGWQIAFVLPEGVTAETAPRPTDPSVEIATLPERRLAVARFSGFLSDSNLAENRTALEGWLSSKGIAHQGDWQWAGYNPPWTIPWLRRNEIWVTLR